MFYCSPSYISFIYFVFKEWVTARNKWRVGAMWKEDERCTIIYWQVSPSSGIPSEQKATAA
jgi:hypothetical protein